MAVDTGLTQVTLEELELYRRDGDRSVYDIIGEAASPTDSSSAAPPPDQRTLEIIGLARWMLADFDDINCAFLAVMAAGNTLEWPGRAGMMYHSADDVKQLAAELEAYPLEKLSEHLDGIMDRVRPAAASLLHGDEEIRNYQIEQWNKIIAFYRRAADANMAVLMDVG